jgi:peptidoglycan/xylan/chitin deacetylase (PgdA/CDA1 family)
MDYLASYDLEDVKRCAAGAKAVAEVHKRRNLPATFFIVGRCLQEHGRELRGILDDPLFDIQSHTFSHALLKDSGVHGAGAALDHASAEISKSLGVIRDVFGRECVGMRTPCGFSGGLRGKGGLLRHIRSEGLRYVSSDARGPGDSLPSPLKLPYTYAEDGFPDIREIPIHGWHDNVLKGYFPNVAIVVYPPLEPWHLPSRPPETPEEDAAQHLLWVDKAAERDLPFISLAFHPWSLIRFDPRVRELDLIFDGLAERDIEVVTATQAYQNLEDRGPVE